MIKDSREGECRPEAARRRFLSKVLRTLRVEVALLYY